MTEVRGKFLTEAANEVMEEAYMKASDNDRLPATARQIFYVARPLIEEQTDRPLSYQYFSQTLLPDFVNEHGAGWDVIYDDRGHFMEPHSKRTIGLGTLNVRAYLSRVDRLRLEEADFNRATVKTYGPDGSFGAVLYVEKEGFLPLFKRVKLARRYDLAIMSSKGMSVTAARELVDKLCGRIPLLVLHDFDSAGIIIADTLENDTRRFSYSNSPTVIDIGLHYEDVNGLPAEPNNSTISAERLSQAGLDQDAVNFLLSRRVELNAMTSRQLVDFVEQKLKQYGIGKVFPDGETLARTYEMFTASDRLSEAFDELKERLEDKNEDPTKVPHDLEAKVRKKLQEQPNIPWHRAVQLIVDPDAEDDEDEDEDEEEDINDDDDDWDDE
jgi:DNA topoisomerase 6 subunit A-like protein